MTTIVWKKNDLPRGDLQMLDQGHSSGVLRLTQAGYVNNGRMIDQTDYFRNDVFSTLQWRPTEGKEVATAQFTLVIESNQVGTFNLNLSHKPSWESGQNNYTTGLHWGDATHHIQREELIGKDLTLHKVDVNNFIISID
jgi:hypothetical protein